MRGLELELGQVQELELGRLVASWEWSWRWRWRWRGWSPGFGRRAEMGGFVLREIQVGSVLTGFEGDVVL